MGTKRRCPACGAKNDMSVRRCRVCTAVINADAPEGGPAEAPAPEPSALADHFDAGVIDRQLQPTRSKFGGGSGALAARLAAANGGEMPSSYTIPSAGPAGAPDAPSAAPADLPAPTVLPPPVAAPLASDSPFEPLAGPDYAPPGPSTAPPIEHEAEPFDPDALFRDMG